ncbi:MAG: hypothetical protein ACO3DS_06665, partial [Phycisphaerales bacterium]
MLGSLLVLLMVAAALAAPMLMKLAAPGGEPPRLPLVLLAFVAVGGMLSLALGVLLGVGGLGVVAQRRVGIARVKRWAVLRLVLAVVSLMVSWVLLPTQVDYMTVARAEANVSNVYAQILDRMATTINNYSANLRTKEGLEYVANNPLTPEDIQLAKEGVTVGLGGGIGKVSGDLPSIFNAAVRKARSLELSSHFEIEGRNELSKMLVDIETGNANSQQVE